jgi:hypothetical protein
MLSTLIEIQFICRVFNFSLDSMGGRAFLRRVGACYGESLNTCQLLRIQTEDGDPDPDPGSINKFSWINNK